MDDRQQVKELFIESATLSSKSLAIGDHKTANKQAKILARIMSKIESGEIDKDILVELLGHDYLSVSALAAIDLLRLCWETDKALGTLEKIAAMDETKMGVDERLTVMAAEFQLKSWREKGFVSR